MVGFYDEPGLVLKSQEVTGPNFTPGNTDYTILCDASSNSVTVDLPKAVNNKGRIYVIKAIDISNAVTVDADGSELIDFAATKVLASPGDSVTLQSDGVQWWSL